MCEELPEGLLEPIKYAFNSILESHKSKHGRPNFSPDTLKYRTREQRPIEALDNYMSQTMKDLKSSE